MTVRAKFYVTAINHRFTNDAGACNAQICLEPVYVSGKGDDNESWSKYTPSGKLEMTVTNPAAVAQFELGKAYYIDFTPVAAG